MKSFDDKDHLYSDEQDDFNSKLRSNSKSTDKTVFNNSNLEKTDDLE